jgi:hypothetical protein
MKRKLIVVILSLCLKTIISASTTTRCDSILVDSVYQILLKMDLDPYIGKSVKQLLTDVGKNYSIFYVEEPNLCLAHITIYYKDSDAHLEVYFDSLEHVHRFSKPTPKRAWEDNDAILLERISKIVLWNNKIKLYPQYIKKTKRKS